MQDNDIAQEYLQVQVMTASQDQLLLMLLDGAVRFVEGAREKITRGEREAKNELLVKAQNIILELIQSLQPTIGEKIYPRLIGLYKFIYRRLVEANLRDSVEKLDEGIKILKEVREMWHQAVASYCAENAAGTSGPAAAAPPQATVQGLSLQA